MPSGRAIDDNDPLSRRDEGIDPPIDVSRQLSTQISKSKAGDDEFDSITITNASSSVVDTHLLVVVKGLSKRVQLQNASGMTSGGDPYLRVFLPQGVLNPRQSISIRLVFDRKPNASPVSYSLSFLSGQGTP